MLSLPCFDLCTRMVRVSVCVFHGLCIMSTLIFLFFAKVDWVWA